MSKRDCSPAGKRLKLGESFQLFDQKLGSNVREVAFSIAYPGRELKLMEVPSDLFKIVEKGEDLRIIGAKNSEAVLCSSTNTYALKRVETSNCVLFVPPSTGARFTIESVSADYYEVRQIAGRVDQMKSLLFPACKYSSDDKVSSGTLYSPAELQQLVQASQEEIVTMLVSMGAVEVAGKVRVVAQETVHSVIAVLLETIIAQQWSLQAVSEQECLGALQASSVSADPVVLQCALRLLSRPVTGSKAEAIPVLPQPAATWALEHNLLKQAAAHVVFQELRAGLSAEAQAAKAPVQVRVEDFLQEWTLRTPGFSLQEVADADLALLAGIAVRTKTAGLAAEEETLFYMPMKELQGADAKARLNTLFSVKGSYSSEELAPYLQDLVGTVGAPKTVQELLALHTRNDPADGLLVLK